jgi:HAD superfamily hydrolase (TIGR01509 family)
MTTTTKLTLPGPFTGVVVDMDGTLVDTEPLWRIAKERIFARYGTDFEPRDHAAVFGRDDGFTAAYLQGRFGLPEERREGIRLEYLGIVAGIFDEGVPIRAGAVELLTALQGVVPVGLASNTRRELVDIVLRRTGLERYLDSVSTADDGAPKPAPDIYLAACRSLGIDPATAVAIEDSPTGIAAARAAGITCIAVPSEQVDGLDGADLVVGSLLDLV